MDNFTNDINKFETNNDNITDISVNKSHKMVCIASTGGYFDFNGVMLPKKGLNSSALLILCLFLAISLILGVYLAIVEQAIGAGLLISGVCTAIIVLIALMAAPSKEEKMNHAFVRGLIMRNKFIISTNVKEETIKTVHNDKDGRYVRITYKIIVKYLLNNTEYIFESNQYDEHKKYNGDAVKVYVDIDKPGSLYYVDVYSHLKRRGLFDGVLVKR
jgi:hypothetical protein